MSFRHPAFVSQLLLILGGWQPWCPTPRGGDCLWPYPPLLCSGNQHWTFPLSESVEDTVLNKFVCPLLIFNSWYHSAALTTSVPREGRFIWAKPGNRGVSIAGEFCFGVSICFSAVITVCFHYINVTDTKFFGKSGRFVAWTWYTAMLRYSKELIVIVWKIFHSQISNQITGWHALWQWCKKPCM